MAVWIGINRVIHVPSQPSPTGFLDDYQLHVIGFHLFSSCPWEETCFRTLCEHLIKRAVAEVKSLMSLPPATHLGSIFCILVKSFFLSIYPGTFRCWLASSLNLGVFFIHCLKMQRSEIFLKYLLLEYPGNGISFQECWSTILLIFILCPLIINLVFCLIQRFLSESYSVQMMMMINHWVKRHL